LIESLDGGVTWAPLSRQGQSDFHALTSSDAGVVGFDGAATSITTDGTTWRELDPPVAPYALTASSDGAVLLATSESGLIRSIDAGDTWTAVDRAPLLQVVDWSERQTAVGVTPDGTVAVSDDNGNSWSERGRVNGPPQAVAALRTAQGQLRVLVVTDDGVWESTDGARTFGSLDTP
nr:exo-alpha-sialidase [Actinomycetota bacterium]